MAATARDEPAVRVLIVDDHALTRQDLGRMIGRHPGLVVVGEAADGQEALRLVQALEPDVVLMDIRMPVMDGLQATRLITAEGHSAVVLISTFEDLLYELAATDAGAVAYLPKSASESDLVAAVVAAARPG